MVLSVSHLFPVLRKITLVRTWTNLFVWRFEPGNVLSDLKLLCWDISIKKIWLKTALFLLIATEYNKAKYIFLLYSGVCWIQMNSTMIHIWELRSTINYFISLRACCCILIALRAHMLALKKSFRLFAGDCKRHTAFLRVSVDTILDRFLRKKLSNSMNIFRYVTLRFRVRPPLQKSRRNHC